MACPQTGPLQGEGPSLVGLSGRRGHTQGQAQNGERPWGPRGSVLWGNGGWFVTEEGHMGTEGRLPPDPFPVYSSVTSHVAASFPPLLMELSTVVLHRWGSARTCCSSRRLLGNEPPRTAPGWGLGSGWLWVPLHRLPGSPHGMVPNAKAPTGQTCKTFLRPCP